MDRGQSRHCLDAVEIYNLDGDFWREGPRLPCPQLSLRTSGPNAGVASGKIYVCGYYKGAGNRIQNLYLDVTEGYSNGLTTSALLSLPLDRHEDIIKDILELDPWDNRWTVVARRALMHDNYDVCLVAHLNPRGLMAPPADLVKL